MDTSLPTAVPIPSSAIHSDSTYALSSAIHVHRCASAAPIISATYKGRLRAVDTSKAKASQQAKGPVRMYDLQGKEKSQLPSKFFCIRAAQLALKTTSTSKIWLTATKHSSALALDINHVFGALADRKFLLRRYDVSNATRPNLLVGAAHRPDGSVTGTRFLARVQQVPT